MARLNDVPGTSADTLEGLKRRFARQNRDLAKTNSIYSVRIRLLETENSKLITATIQLQEENLRLHNRIEELCEKPARIRDQLLSKLQDVAAALTELGEIPSPKRQKRSPRKEPLQRPLRPPINEDLIDIRLPPIDEEGHWPGMYSTTEERQSLELQDLGTPPVTRFDLDEASATASRNLSIVSSDDEEDEAKKQQQIVQDFNVNIETRRKRKDSTSKRLMVFDGSPEPNNATEERPQTSRKRKLLNDLPIKNEENTKEPTFLFSLRASRRNGTMLLITDDDRKALGDKPVNTDPVLSPRKLSTALHNEKVSKRPTTPLVGKEAARQRIKERKINKEVKYQAEHANNEAVQQDIILPKTPAALERILSPQSEPFSSDTPAGNDTPPPPEAIGRPSRRARSAVNYAEPSLISKMRRPTKELADAVGKDGRSIAVKNPLELEKPTSQWRPAFSANIGEGLAQGDEPTSPLTSKVSVKQETIEQTYKAEEEEEEKNSESEIQAVVSVSKGVNRRRSQAVQITTRREMVNDDTARKTTDLAIFDFTDSSPSEVSLKGTAASRRHSTIAGRSNGVVVGTASSNTSTKAKVPTAANTTRITKPGPGRRKSMMI